MISNAFTCEILYEKNTSYENMHTKIALYHCTTAPHNHYTTALPINTAVLCTTHGLSVEGYHE
jgi:hypothetical protein